MRSAIIKSGKPKAESGRIANTPFRLSAFRFRLPSGSAFLTLLALLLTGCGPVRPETAPLAGQVTLDGQPLAGAALVFMPVAGGRPAQAVTDAEGRFEAWTFEPGDGALLGEHHVTVSRVTIVGVQATEHGLEGPSQGPVRTESSLPSRYGNAAISGLSAQVKPGEDNFVELALSSR